MVTTRSSKRQSLSASASAASRGWRHVPSKLTLGWMALSLPLVIWDTIYILGRPHTLEGGALYWPMYVPYKLYGTIDLVYGWDAWNSSYGFTAAQGSLNLVETVMYFLYLWLSSKAAADTAKTAARTSALAALVGLTAAAMTLSKTVLYWLQEYWGEYSHIGHNTAYDLILLWIIPNGAWLIGPTYMIWELGKDILDGLSEAPAHSKNE